MTRATLMGRSGALAVLAAGVCLGQAQSTKVTAHLSNQSWIPANGSLSLSINGILPATEWIVGVKASSGTKHSLAVGAAQLGAAVHGGHRPLSALVDWPSASLTVNGSNVSIAGQQDPTLALVVYTEVSLGTHVVINYLGKAVVDSTVNADGVFVHNGQAIPESLDGLARVLSKLQAPIIPAAPQPDLMQLRDGTYAVSRSNMRTHVVAAPLPAVQQLSANCSCVLRASFSLQIDALGKVTNVQSTLGDAALIAALQPSLTQWQFKPFSSGQSNVPVRSGIHFTVDRTGALIW